MRCPSFDVSYIDKDGNTKYGCDSWHAVDSDFSHTWQKMDTNQIVSKLDTMTPKGTTPDIVITGGEPLVYWRDSEFNNLLEYYHQRENKITIETNGSIDIDLDKEYHKDLLFSISIKLSNSGESIDKRVNYKALTKMLNTNKSSYLKFVIDKKSIDILEKEILEIINRLDISPSRVFLMPLGANATDIEQNAEETINLAIKHGFRYSDRLHIRVWNNKRGV
jgi:organic radical activating enzyme